MRAVRDIQRLRMFPVVFPVNPVMSAALGDSYGEPCVQCHVRGSISAA